MYLLVAKQYLQAQAKILKILVEYFPLFCSFSKKTFIFNVILQSLQGQFSSFHFLTLFLSVFKLLMSYIFGPRNETFSLLWYAHFTSGFENLEICLKLYQLLSFCVKYHS